MMENENFKPETLKVTTEKIIDIIDQELNKDNTLKKELPEDVKKGLYQFYTISQNHKIDLSLLSKIVDFYDQIEPYMIRFIKSCIGQYKQSVIPLTDKQKALFEEAQKKRKEKEQEPLKGKREDIHATMNCDALLADNCCYVISELQAKVIIEGETIKGLYIDVLEYSFAQTDFEIVAVKKPEKYISNELSLINTIFSDPALKGKALLGRSKGKDIKQAYVIEDGFTQSEEYNALSDITRTVYNAWLSFEAAGAEYVTDKMIYEFMTQRKLNTRGDKRAVPAFVHKEIDHCRQTFITSDFTDLYKIKKKSAGDDLKIKGRNPLINCVHRYVIINGVAIHAYKIIPDDLYLIAKETNYLRTYSNTEYALPDGVKGTESNLILKDYILHRISSLTAPKSKANKYIDFNTIYEKYGNYKELTREEKKQARDITCKLLDHIKKEMLLQEHKKGEMFLKDYKIISEGKKLCKIELIIDKG